MAESIKKFIIKDVHGSTKESGSFSVVGEVHVDIVPGYGEPYADSEYVNGILTITIHNIEGNGITDITTDSQEGDEAVNTVTIKTNANPEGVTLEVRNGSRGNGIVSTSEVLSPEDGGTNTHTFIDTDGNEHVFHTKNGQTGRKGDQGDSAVYDPSSPDAPDFVMANTTGQSTTKAMTQKAVTDELLVDGEQIFQSQHEDVQAYINGSANKWTSGSSTYISTFIPVTPGTIIKITANQNGATFAFLTTKTYTINTTPSYAGGATTRNDLSANASSTFIVPNDAEYLLVAKIINNINYIPKEIRIMKKVNSIPPQKVSTLKRIDSTVSALINSSSKWVTGDTNKTILIAVTPGLEYRVTTNSNQPTDVSFLTDKTGITNNSTPHFANGWTKRLSLLADKTYNLVAPNNASYMTFLAAYNGNDHTPYFIEELEDVSSYVEKLGIETKVVNVRLQRMALNEANGKYGTGSYVNAYSTPKMYRVPKDGVVKLTFSATAAVTGAKVVGYDKDKKFVSAIIPIAATKGIPVEMEMLDWKYFKVGIGVAANEGSDPVTYPDIVDMVMEGQFSENFEHYNMPQGSPDSDGNWTIPMTISIDAATPTTQDIETATVTDVVNIQFDHGMLALPSTYTPDGEPTRLIIFSHGSAKHITAGQTTWPTDAYGVDPTYWLSEGYAVMDMDGLPDDTTTAHWCVPVAYQCLLEGYRHVIDNYNICKDGVFLGGRSLGGAMALTIMAMEHIPIIACCPFSPAGPNSNRYFYFESAAVKQKIADACGIYNPDSVAWQSNSFPTELLTMEYATVNGNEKYIGNFGRLMQFSPSYRLIVNNPSVEALTDEKMFSTNSNVLFSYLNEIYGECVIKTRIPTKFFGAYDDTTVYPTYTNLWVRMFRNGGCVCEQRMFPTGGHPFDLADANRVEEFVNSKGNTLEDVPIAYIEALQFWRSYE